jgi:outer membrane receptor for ferrienterochelin and colicin
MGLSFVYRGDPFIDLYDGYYDDKGNVGFERKLNSAAMTAVSLNIGAGYLVSRKISAGGSISINHQSLPTTPNVQGSVENSSITSIGGLDIMASYRASSDLTLSAGVKNLMRHNSWFIHSYSDFSPVVDETVPPVFVLASSHKILLFERELVWNADAQSYFFDGEGKYIRHPEMVIAAGARWKFSEELALRAGVGDIDLSGELWRRSGEYWETFSPRIALGFSYHLKRLMHGAFFNYALATDRVWAGVDQQFDITVSF